jgi:hypothetical protein
MKATTGHKATMLHALYHIYIIVVRAHTHVRLSKLYGVSAQMGSRWMARAAKLAVFEKRDVNPFARPMRWMACGGTRVICHLLRMTVSSRDSF